MLNVRIYSPDMQSWTKEKPTLNFNNKIDIYFKN